MASGDRGICDRRRGRRGDADQCCQAVDLAEALSARIAEDGEIIRTMNGIKAHPAIKDGLAARSFVVRTLQKLGLNFEPLRTAPGRPQDLSHADENQTPLDRRRTRANLLGETVALLRRARARARGGKDERNFERRDYGTA